MNNAPLSPVSAKKRYVWLDALRGLAVLGICMANYPEFSLWSFKGAEEMGAMPTAEADRALRWVMLTLIDGKFYSIFSLLFGIGFAIILANVAEKGGNALTIFYRRMAGLLLIGLLHIALLWSGDILMLYALLGMLLPLFRNVSNRGLLLTACGLLLLPVAVDLAIETWGLSPSAPLHEAQWELCRRYGITEDNFAYWLRDADSYAEVLQFLAQGAVVRAYEFVEGNRYFKVLGLFLIGFYIGRNRLYADIRKHEKRLRLTAICGFAWGLPLSLAYAWSAMSGHPIGLAGHTLLYTLSVYPMALAYFASFALLYTRFEHLPLWRWLAAPGRMALTSYIGQSALGMLLFYGVGLGLGAGLGLCATELTALAVYTALSCLSLVWLRAFRFGPLEWLWRMFTYGRTFSLRKR